MTLTQLEAQMTSILRAPRTWWDLQTLQDRRKSVDESISRQIDVVTAWNLAGVVQAYWNDTVQFIVKETHQKNSRCINNGVDWRGPMDCFMVGMTVEQATPTVVLTGPDISVLKRMGTKLKRDHRFRRTGFKIRGNNGLLKNCNDDTAPQSPEQTLLEAKVDFFGRSLCFLESPGVRQFATIGAVIKISENHFALTAAHVFEHDTDRTVPTDTRPEATYAGEILDDEFFDSFEDEGYDELSNSPDDQDRTRDSSEHQFSQRVRFEPSSTSRIVFSQNEPVIASTAAICHPEDEHTDNTTTLFMNRSLDWAIVDLKNWTGYEPVNFLVKNGVSLSTVDCAKHDPQGEVMIVSQACMYPIARCSGTQALVRMPGCDSFQSVFTLESLPSGQQPISTPISGQSGALVIDKISGEAYGMLAAQCMSLNMQYMIPLHHIFQDMSHYFRDEVVVLPTGETQTAFKTHVDAVETVLLNHSVRGTTPLHVAAAVGDPVVVKAHVRAGADMTARDDQGTVPLHLAALNGHAEVVQAFIAAGAPEESRDNLGQTALILAAERLLTGGSSAITSDRHRNYLATVDLLLRNGAEVNDQIRSFDTLLHMVSEAGQVQVVELLLQHGADVDTQCGSYGTALYAASKAGHLQVVNLLLQHGANVNIQCGSYGTALHAASAAGHTQIVELLLQRGANVNIQCGSYGTALCAASAAGHTQIVKLLLPCVANVNIQGNWYGTALRAASEAGHKQIVEFLLQRGANVNIQDDRYGTGLHTASAAGHTQIVELLLQHGANVDILSDLYGTALHAASKVGRLQIVELLLHHGANINIQGGSCGTALYTASKAGHLQVVELLLQHGASIDTKCGLYGTALHAASKAGHTQIVELLLQHGALDYSPNLNDGNAEEEGTSDPRGVYMSRAMRKRAKSRTDFSRRKSARSGKEDSQESASAETASDVSYVAGNDFPLPPLSD